MALMTGYGNSGDSLDFYAWDASGNIHNGSAWVEWSDVDFESYRIAAVEQGTSGRYEAELPAGTVAYDLRFRGAALADSYLVWADAAQHGLTAGQAANIALIDDVKVKTDLISADGVAINADPNQPDGVRSIIRGDGYGTAHGHDFLTWTDTEDGWPDLSAGTPTLTFTVRRRRRVGQDYGDYIFSTSDQTRFDLTTAGGHKQITLTLEADETQTFPIGCDHQYDIQAKWSDTDVNTPVGPAGVLEVKADQTGPAS